MVQECLKEEAAQGDFKILSCVCLFVCLFQRLIYCCIYFPLWYNTIGETGEDTKHYIEL